MTERPTHWFVLGDDLRIRHIAALAGDPSPSPVGGPLTEALIGAPWPDLERILLRVLDSARPCTATLGSGDDTTTVHVMPMMPDGLLVTLAHDPSAAASAAREPPQASTASTAKREFLANMSHEVRTPLAAILGYADLLRPHVTSEDGRRFVDTLRRKAQQLLAIVSDVLDLSRMERGRIEAASRPFSPGELLHTVRQLYQESADQRLVHLAVDVDATTPSRALGDPQRLRQVLGHLVSNGLKFTEEGTVTLRVYSSADRPPWLVFDVIDTGIGFQQERAAEVFSVFTQLDAAGTRRFAGAGLGLTICQRLVEVMGGTIEARSTPGVGSIFRVRVPVEWADHDPGPALATPVAVPPARSTAPPAGALTGRILIVDDDPDLREISRVTLEQAGATVDEAVDGLAALRLLRASQPYDLILMDIQMPDVDGLETTRRLRDEGVTAPIVALTARELPEDRAQALQAGCTEHLTKPVKHETLVDTARRLMDLPSRNSVLLVDDDEDITELLSLLLEDEGFEVRSAHSPAVAHAAMGARPAAVVIADLTLETSGDGLVLGRELRQRHPGARLIALSGAPDQRDAALASGFDAFALKPLDPSDLGRVVRGDDAS